MKQTPTLEKLSFDGLETRLLSLNEIVLNRLENEVKEDQIKHDSARDILIGEILTEYAKVNPSLDLKLISEAAKISYEAHKGHKRKSGLPYITHPYQVGYVLALMGMDSETVAAGLNNDAIEKSGAKRKEITKMIIGLLGDSVLELVLAVTRIPIGEIYGTGYDWATQNKILEMMKKIDSDTRIDAINVADGISNLLSIDGLRAGPRNSVDTRLKSLQNSEFYVRPAALRLDNAFDADGNFKFYDFVNLLIQRGKTNLTDIRHSIK